MIRGRPPADRARCFAVAHDVLVVPAVPEVLIRTPAPGTMSPRYIGRGVAGETETPALGIGISVIVRQILPQPSDRLTRVPGRKKYFICIDVFVPNIRTVTDRADQALEARQAEQVPLHVRLVDNSGDIKPKVSHRRNQGGHFIDLGYNPSPNRPNNCRLHNPDPVSHIA
jgi:hypothetical protein